LGEKDTINLLSDNERTVFEEIHAHPKVTANDLSEILNINLRNTKKIIEKLKEKVYETTTRPREVLETKIELWNRSTGEITFPKGKYNR
jgi:transcription initiation factor IIE alpha subunit